MRIVVSLLAVAMLTASTGCNCCPCLRNICPFGACTSLCRPRSCPPPPVTYAPAPVACAPTCAPAPAPVYAAAPTALPVYGDPQQCAQPQQYAAPQQYTVPQYAAPQYAMPAPQPMYAESSCGMSYTVAEPSCSCSSDVGYGTPPDQQMIATPGPAAP